MRIFITGVAGFLGSHIADAMLDNGDTVIGVDNMMGGFASNIPKGVEFHMADCCDFDRMKALMQNVDVVYHCAATAYEGLSVFSPSLISRNIVDASVTVFSAAIANKVKRIVHCSSMARYGEGMRSPLDFSVYGPPFLETYEPNPQDPYGIAKVCAENMLKNLCRVHGMEYVIAVPHNIIGPRQKYDDPYRNVASIMMNLMLQNRSPTIYGDGSQSRCFSYVSDCVDCLVQMGDLERADLVGHVINIGPDEEPVTINELYNEVAAVTGFNGEPVYKPGRPQEVHTALCSSAKARRMLGYSTKVPLRVGLRYMRNWMLAQGPKPFNYHLPLEIVNDKTPATWADRLF